MGCRADALAAFKEIRKSVFAVAPMGQVAKGDLAHIQAEVVQDAEGDGLGLALDARARGLPAVLLVRMQQGVAQLVGQGLGPEERGTVPGHEDLHRPAIVTVPAGAAPGGAVRLDQLDREVQDSLGAGSQGCEYAPVAACEGC